MSGTAGVGEPRRGYDPGAELYLLPTTIEWKDIRHAANGHPLIAGNINASGVILFYDSLEAFKKDFPDEEPIVVSVLDVEAARAGKARPGVLE